MRQLCENYVSSTPPTVNVDCLPLSSNLMGSVSRHWSRSLKMTSVGHTFSVFFLNSFFSNTSFWSFQVVSLSQSESFFFLELLLLLCTMWPELLLLVMLMLFSSQLLLLVLMLLLLPVCAVSTAGESFWKAEKRSATCIGILTWIDDTDSSLFDFILTLQLCYISDC